MDARLRFFDLLAKVLRYVKEPSIVLFHARSSKFGVTAVIVASAHNTPCGFTSFGNAGRSWKLDLVLTFARNSRRKRVSCVFLFLPAFASGKAAIRLPSRYHRQNDRCRRVWGHYHYLPIMVRLEIIPTKRKEKKGERSQTITGRCKKEEGVLFYLRKINEAEVA